jgi:hypothetical protein
MEVKPVRPPLSHNNFRMHQQLNHVAPLPPAAVLMPLPLVSMGSSQLSHFLFAGSLVSAPQCRNQLLSGLKKEIKNGNSNVCVKKGKVQTDGPEETRPYHADKCL